MGKHAYLIISDLHDFCKNLDNRVDYPGEIAEVKEHIIRIGMEYSNKGYEVNAILLGDVNNRSYPNVNGAILNNNYWIAANELFGRIYNVLGNHETTYYTSNPFFTLLNSMESEKVRSVYNKVWKPIGIFDVFHVIDRLEDGNVAFHFNHYGCPVTYPDKSKFNIGLFHTDFVFNEIAKASEDAYHMDAFIKHSISAENNELLELYDICFFAHHHKLYGCWQINTTKGNTCHVYHLASLGRPNVTEVNDNFLERNIPVVIIEDDEFKTVEDNKIRLRSRSQCVLEEVVELNHKAYERTKALRIAADYTPIADDPVRNLQTFCADSPYLSEILDGLLVADKDILTQGLEEELRKEGISVWG